MSFRIHGAREAEDFIVRAFADKRLPPALRGTVHARTYFAGGDPAVLMSHSAHS